MIAIDTVAMPIHHSSQMQVRIDTPLHASATNLGHITAAFKFILSILTSYDGAAATGLVVEVYSEELATLFISDVESRCFTFFGGSMDVAVFDSEVDVLFIVTKVCCYEEWTCTMSHEIV